MRRPTEAYDEPPSVTAALLFSLISFTFFLIVSSAISCRMPSSISSAVTVTISALVLKCAFPCAPGILPATPLLGPRNHSDCCLVFHSMEVDVGTTQNGGHSAPKHVQSRLLGPSQNFPYSQNTRTPLKMVVDYPTTA
ncbi:hypothetical protein Ccrd_006618 [Cynara cardunculus var. scolymus]|uniref:Uncharacterized protein n=1 Tax=Cynara cardunculus var. scolymus TaxID=59895 RepID=A0A118JUQ2_CYNCS|nr:hypothetical protein Ccrd_006618 [Cynara cardunculus var. scolymus]